MFAEKNRAQHATPIEKIESVSHNNFYIKRDDLLPFSFGGNKARKAGYFFREILSGGYDTVVTYGSSSSNHCRVIANLAAKNAIKCYIVSPEENYTETFNSILIKKFGAEIVKAPIDKISETIDALMTEFSEKCKPYFIQGGGHGNLGTQAYVDAYKEICDYENENNCRFDYIFHASGTGTTQAGLVCGAILNGDFDRKIVGISIARTEERGKAVVEQSVKDYLKSVNYNGELIPIEFDDSYICGGYGKYNCQIAEWVDSLIVKEGIPLNTTYTGKAFWGMMQYIEKNGIEKRNILFINTGGSPLFFDNMGVLR